MEITSRSEGLWGVVESFLPSLLVAFLGFCGHKLLNYIGSKHSPEGYNLLQSAANPGSSSQSGAGSPGSLSPSGTRQSGTAPIGFSSSSVPYQCRTDSTGSLLQSGRSQSETGPTGYLSQSETDHGFLNEVQKIKLFYHKVQEIKRINQMHQYCKIL